MYILTAHLLIKTGQRVFMLNSLGRLAVKLLRAVPAPVKAWIPNIWKAQVLNSVVADSMEKLDLGGGARFLFLANDSYYAGRKARDIRAYEPEIWFILDKFLQPDSLFIDCGANAGLWSSYATTKIKDSRRIIAVEPNTDILPTLEKNHAANNKGFTILRRAVFSNAGKELEFCLYPKHCSSQLRVSGQNIPSEATTIRVKTTTIDEIVSNAPYAQNIIIKLDVEGAESAALEGAANTIITNNALIAYEDHGKDPDSKTTDFFLEKGLRVYYLDTESNPVHAIPITRAKHLSDIKTIPTKGYNFIACKKYSEFDKQMQFLQPSNSFDLYGCSEDHVRALLNARNAARTLPASSRKS